MVKNLRALLLLVSFAMFIILQLTGCVDSAGLKSAASIESTLESAESASDSLPITAKQRCIIGRPCRAFATNGN